MKALSLQFELKTTRNFDLKEEDNTPWELRSNGTEIEIVVSQASSRT